MRKIKYTRHWSYLGPGQKTEGSLLDLILDIPYSGLNLGVMPPLHVLNQLLVKGGDSGGMGPGTKWRPFKISEAEYEELVAALTQLDIKGARKQHPYAPTRPIIEDRTLHHYPDFSTWLAATAQKYRPAADSNT